MEPKAKIDAESLIRMIQAEERAEYHRYKFETESPLSRMCESADALGPLVLTEKLGFTQWKVSGNIFYSRFRSGDRVEVRVQKTNADRSVRLVDGWRVDAVNYPSPGKIELIISGERPFEDDKIKEVFLFKSSSSMFKNLLLKKIRDIPLSKGASLLGHGNYDLSVEDVKFKKIYEQLNDTQKSAVHHLVGNNLSGAIQGPPGTGKTQLLQAVIRLALSSNMRVCVTSFTNAAVDNLLGKYVRGEFDHDWVRVGDSGRVRKELYGEDFQKTNFVSPNFRILQDEEYNLVGSTLHKLAFNSSSLEFDLLIIDEAGQVPLFFWPFIQRLAKRLVLVGDQFQLPPVLTAQHPNLPCDSIFSLFVNDETPMLETQYRMRREIQAWSSEKFYRGKLFPHVSVSNRDYFDNNPAFLTDSFVVPKMFDSENTKKCSQKEADYITDKVERIVKSRESLGTVGIICPFRSQAGVINAALQNRLGVAAASKVLVDTVERFQGQEREAIFVSFGSSGSSQEELRFLSDPRRLNVAVTRAKSRFYCLFDKGLFEQSQRGQSQDLNEFLQWVRYGRALIKRAA